MLKVLEKDQKSKLSDAFETSFIVYISSFWTQHNLNDQNLTSYEEIM